MSIYNIGFCEKITKIIFHLSQISSNTHLICSSKMCSVFAFALSPQCGEIAGNC